MLRYRKLWLESNPNLYSFVRLRKSLDESVNDGLTATPAVHEGFGFILVVENVGVEDLTVVSFGDLDYGMVFVIGSEDIHCGNRITDTL